MYNFRLVQEPLLRNYTFFHSTTILKKAGTTCGNLLYINK